MTEAHEPSVTDMVAEDGGPWGDIVAGLIFLAISVVGGWMVLSDPALVSTDYGADPGPGMLPQIALGLLFLMSAALVGQAAVRLTRAEPSDRIVLRTRWRIGIPALMVATLLAYALAFPEVGFIWATLAFAVFWSVLLGIIEFRPAGNVGAYAVYVAEAAVITVLIWLAFAKLIRIPLP